MTYSGRNIFAFLVMALGAAGAACAQTSSASRPTTTRAAMAFDPQRFNELIALVEGNNSPQARRTGARELLRSGWNEAVGRLAAILAGAQRDARVAVALAISDIPGSMRDEFVEPLIKMLGDEDPEVRSAAAVGLATAAPDGVLTRLRELMLDASQPLEVRQAAVQTLGLMPWRAAAAALVEALARRDDPIAYPALRALQETAGRDFQDDFDAALRWWQQVRDVDQRRWAQMQMERLARQNRAAHQRLAAVERRLAAALRDSYLRAPEARRPVLLQAFLSDSSATVRQLGLELVQSLLADGKTPAPETIAQVRELLAAREPEVRAAAVRTVATLRDQSDGARFLAMLARERSTPVRVALANGLGYVGDNQAAGPLLELLSAADRDTVVEAITALGRLAERRVLDQESAQRVGAALLEKWRATPPDANEIRERLLWAMARLEQPRFGAVFVAALDTPPSAAVRLAALRGIEVLADPRLAARASASQPAGALSPGRLIDALVPLVADPDPGVRRAAVETLARYARSDEHIAALWTRLDPQTEPEEEIRVLAWRAVLPLVAAKPPAEIATWLARLPGEQAGGPALAIELLENAIKLRSGKAAQRGECGHLRVALAEQLAAKGDIDAALKTYETALADLHAADPQAVGPVALELLQLSVASGKYGQQVAAALAGNPPLDPAAAWQTVRGEVEKRMNPEQIDRAVAMLTAVKEHPPTSMPASLARSVDELLGQARQMQGAADAAAVKAAVARLRSDAGDAAARQAIEKLGRRAVGPLKALLAEALKAEKPDGAYVVLLHDLLKTLVPDWAGFAPDAPAAEQLKAVEALGQ